MLEKLTHPGKWVASKALSKKSPPIGTHAPSYDYRYSRGGKPLLRCVIMRALVRWARAYGLRAAGSPANPPDNRNGGSNRLVKSILDRKELISVIKLDGS